jgi:hypothetical protein
MNLRTELAITGLGVALLMLLVFLAPAPVMAQDRVLHYRRIVAPVQRS